MTVGDKDIFPTVIVVVEEIHAETEILAVCPKPRANAGVFELPCSVVVVEGG